MPFYIGPTGQLGTGRGLPGSGSFGGGGGWLGDIGDFLEDAGRIVDIIGGGDGDGGGGGWNPGFDLGGGSGKSLETTLVAVENKPNIKQGFISFLRSVQVADSWLRDLTGLPTLSWPAAIARVLELWLQEDQPSTGRTGNGIVVREQIPPEYFGPSTLPTQPGTGVGGFGLQDINNAMPIVMAATPTMVFKAPPGMVTVKDPYTGEKKFLNKQVARAMGLWRPRKKAPISAKDWDAAKKAKRIETKLSKMLKGSCNFKVTQKR